MRVLGMITTVALGIAAAAAVLVGVSSRKDVERYIRIRNM